MNKFVTVAVACPTASEQASDPKTMKQNIALMGSDKLMRLSIAATVACIIAGAAVAQNSQATATNVPTKGVGAGVGQGVRPQIKESVSLPSGDLAPALSQFADSRKLYLIYAQDDVLNHRTPGAAGELTADETLNQLLKDTGLTYRYLDDKTITIVPITSGPANDKKSLTSLEKTSWRLAQSESGSTSGVKNGNQNDSKESTEGVKLEEVVVTAQKKEESLQDVPIAISVLSGADLDSSPVQGVLEAMRTIPALTMFTNPQTGGTTLSIRGVGAGSPLGALFSGSTTIGYYLDDVPFGFVKTGEVPDAGSFDLQRVEVLRGPQGSLYGASALNGVVRIMTHEAELDVFDVKGRATMSQTHRGGENYRGDVAINVPLVEGKLAARLVAGVADISGWVDRPLQGKKDTNDGELRNYRLKLRAKPTEKLGLSFGAWASRSDFGAVASSSDDRTHPARDEPSHTDFNTYSMGATYDFANATLTSAMGYIEYDNSTRLDFRGEEVQGLITAFDAKVFSEEIRLVSNKSRGWRWSIGGIYRNGRDDLYQDLYPEGLEFPIDNTDRSESFALFGESTWGFLDDTLDLTLGLRYFEDRVAAIENIHPFEGGPVAPTRRAKFDPVTPRAVLTWRPSIDLTAYASVGQGFRSGLHQYAFIVAANPDFAATKEDTLWNYEIGTKATLFGGKLALETALYYIDWKDVQQSVGVEVGVNDAQGDPVLATAAINAGSASGAGVDFGLKLRPLQGLNLGLTVAWNDLNLDQEVLSFGEPIFTAGSRLVNSPEYTAGVNGSYEFPLGANGFTGEFAASADYHSPNEGRGIVGGRSFPVPADKIITSRLGFSVIAPKHWTGTLFVENLNDEDGVIAGDLQDLLVTPPIGSRLRPRTVGVQFEYQFQ